MVKTWLEYSLPRALGSIPGQGTKILQATWCSQKVFLKSYKSIKKKSYGELFYPLTKDTQIFNLFFKIEADHDKYI